jgi:YD repeat-containing protein
MDLSFYEEPCETTPINVSTWTFKLMAKNAAGVTQWTWNNADFVAGATTNQRIVTLTAVTTATYVVGEYAYDLQVTKADGVYTYMTGFVIVEDQITS